MGGVGAKPFPPGDYDVVVVGSGPGGLQTSYCLRRLGVRHAVVSADDGPGGMFRAWPVFQRLISSSKLDAPYPPSSREYEWYDHNSLVADSPEHRALVPAAMDRAFVVPSRPEMEAGLAAFAERTGTAVRYRCSWEATRRDADGRLVLETSDGPYRCRAGVFAIGVTEPWKPSIPGLEDVPHYVATTDPRAYQGKRVAVVGKRNSAFEIAEALLPWACQVVLISPRPVEVALPLAVVSVRYFEPLEDAVRGGGTFVLDAAVERVERVDGRYRVRASSTHEPRDVELESDAVIAATGFRTPVRDLPALGLTTVSQSRVPALTPFFESRSVPDVFFAGNATVGAPGLRKNGIAPNSSSIRGFRYNARVLAEHVAERLGAWQRPRPPMPAEGVSAELAAELARAPELWTQKGYLARAVSLGADGPRDEGIVPLEHFVDAGGPDAAAVCVQIETDGTIFPGVYVRRGGRLREVALDPHPVNAFDGPSYQADLERLLGLSRR